MLKTQVELPVVSSCILELSLVTYHLLDHGSDGQSVANRNKQLTTRVLPRPLWCGGRGTPSKNLPSGTTPLTLSQTTNFRILQTERVCTRQF